MTGEEWRPVPGYKGTYDISNFGRVRSRHRHVKRRDGTFYFQRGKVLGLYDRNYKDNVDPQLSVALYLDGKRRNVLVRPLLKSVWGVDLPARAILDANRVSDLSSNTDQQAAN